MSNQALLWSLIILPWFTLFFMRGEVIKRFMPVGLFSALTSIIIVEVGQTLGWWIFGETAYPLKTPSYIFGLNLITTIWVFHFFYGRFWRFLAVDLVLNLGFIIGFHVYFLGSRGLFQEVSMNPYVNALLTTVFGVLAYGFQAWLDGAFDRVLRTSPGMQPVLAKPLPEDQGPPYEDDR